MRRAKGFFSCGIVCAALVGCSSTFDRDWYHYVPSETDDPLIGRWQGTWKSYRTEEQGELSCIISRQAKGRYQLRLRLLARRLWTRKYEYTLEMKVEQSGKGWKLEGRKDFGWGRGGVVHYRGELKGDDFSCLYSAEEDRGVFELMRYSDDASSA